jgi:hypothetical protein
MVEFERLGTLDELKRSLLVCCIRFNVNILADNHLSGGGSVRCSIFGRLLSLKYRFP